MVESCGFSHTGSVRHNNEDRILLEPSLGLFLVADGMGGQLHGEVAAELASATVKSYIQSSQERADVTWPFGYSFDLSLHANRLATAIRLANRQVWRRAEQGPEFVGMGTTVAAILFTDGAAVIANVGDSRGYLFRNGELTQLTTDDTWIASLFATGLLGADEARKHPMRNVLTQAAGSQETVDVHIREERLQQGDILLLCSDGLHGPVAESVMQSILASGLQAMPMGEQLIAAALERGAPDNVSAVVVRYYRET